MGIIIIQIGNVINLKNNCDEISIFAKAIIAAIMYQQHINPNINNNIL